MGPSHAQGIELSPVTLHAPAQSFIHQVGDLLTADLHIGKPLPRQQQLGGEGVGFLLELGPECLSILAVGNGGFRNADARCAVDGLISREGNRKAIKQVIANSTFLWVVGGN